MSARKLCISGMLFEREWCFGRLHVIFSKIVHLSGRSTSILDSSFRTALAHFPRALLGLRLKQGFQGHRKSERVKSRSFWGLQNFTTRLSRFPTLEESMAKGLDLWGWAPVPRATYPINLTIAPHTEEITHPSEMQRAALVKIDDADVRCWIAFLPVDNSIFPIWVTFLFDIIQASSFSDAMNFSYSSERQLQTGLVHWRSYKRHGCHADFFFSFRRLSMIFFGKE